jgi:site-specific DNA-adenine methylase
LELFRELSEKLQRAEIINGDFRSTLRHACQGALFYIDPPYTGTGDKRGYDRYVWPPFQRADLERLQRFVEAVARRNAHVIVSYSGTRLPWFVPSEFECTRLEIYRSISSDGARGRKKEICACSDPSRFVRRLQG